jgi:MraZ protein
MRYVGTFRQRLDEKGRLILPAKYRDELAGGLYLAKGQERCVSVFPPAEFERQAADLSTAPQTSPRVRDYSRIFFASVSDEVPDKQGRIRIPQELRDYAGLQRDCAVIGAASRLEIWDAAAWDSYMREREDAFSNQTEEVLPGKV